MADYYTHFSLIVTLPSTEAQAYAMRLAAQAEEWAGQITPAFADLPDFPACLLDYVEGWCFETELATVKAPTDDGEPAIWLHSDNGGIDSACEFIKHLLEKFDPTGVVTFEWSHTCSKPRIDAYGGGAALVTANSVVTMTTHEWLQQQIAALNLPTPISQLPS